jgi:hypothetical protein
LVSRRMFSIGDLGFHSLIGIEDCWK